MVFSMVAVFIPHGAEAAYSPSSITGSSLTTAEIKEIVLASYKYNFNTAEEMLNYELGQGYLDYVSSSGGAYTLYVNRHTGVVYYKNNVTGEILTSNPYNIGYGNLSEDILRELMSQVIVKYSLVGGSSSEISMTGAEAAERGQISVSAIANGIRVNYTLGDTTTRYLAPGQITDESFRENIIKPIIESFAADMYKYMVEEIPEQLLPYYTAEDFAGLPYSFFESDNVNYTQSDKYGAFDITGGLRKYLKDMQSYYQLVYPTDSELRDMKRKDPDSVGDYVITPEVKGIRKYLDDKYNSINGFFSNYSVYNPNNKNFQDFEIEEFSKIVKVYEDGVIVWALKDGAGLKASNFIKKYCPEYNFQQMALDESECKYVAELEQNPVFRCSLEYSFNEDGSLSVRLPANSITFDETVYILKEISPLTMFGSGDLTREGYIFVPDGSGSIIEFEDFYNANLRENATLYLEMYGKDYSKAALRENTGYIEQVTMPVFGLITTDTANEETKVLCDKDEISRGYFAILEEGSSLASLIVNFGGTNHRFASSYVAFSPNPSDTFKLSDTISVGGAGYVTKVSESKYSGSYVTRYVMLSDTDLVTAAKLAGENVPDYEPDYNGMARYYRDYLKNNGTLTALETTYENLPLYIEALGSMEIVKKIMSFPVTTDIPLTTFEDVATMYEELSTIMETAKASFLAKAEEYKELAEKTEAEAKVDSDRELANSYREKSLKYLELAENAVNLNNINFKLTGFANGGMYYTYPTKVKWEKIVGGSDGFAQLLNTAAAKTGGNNVFGIYPEFDFTFINNTATFDGISTRKTASKMVDNRYASKQTYNSIYGRWESIYAMVISPDSFDGLYDKFSGKYLDYGVSNLSVSTLGEVLNSNFDKDNPINREESVAYVSSLLDRMANEDNLSLMVSKGNVYTLKYVDHVINISTDSSHYRYSSYNVPFLGMVLHGYVNYAGSALNYAGSPMYNMLHAIENGASLYYILCYQNTGFMKDDLALNSYYGVDYKNWRDEMVEQYTELNMLLRELQTYEIVNHRTLIAERVIEDGESQKNLELMMNEFISELEKEIEKEINRAYNEMSGDISNIGRGIKLTVNTNQLMSVATDKFAVGADELRAAGFDAMLSGVKAKYEKLYNSANENAYLLSVSNIEYESKYDFVTDSYAYDKDYDLTDYTVNNDLVTIVTYRDAKTGDEVKFIINYNIYAVEVRFDANTSYSVGKLGYVRID